MYLPKINKTTPKNSIKQNCYHFESIKYVCIYVEGEKQVYHWCVVTIKKDKLDIGLEKP